MAGQRSSGQSWVSHRDPAMVAGMRELTPITDSGGTACRNKAHSSAEALYQPTIAFPAVP